MKNKYTHNIILYCDEMKLESWESIVKILGLNIDADKVKILINIDDIKDLYEQERN